MKDSYVCVPENSVCDSRVTDDMAPSAFHVFPPLIAENWIAIPDESGLLVLDLANGGALLDWADPAPQRAPWYFVHTAQYRVEGLSCEGEARSGRPLAICGDNLLFFSGRTAVLVDVRNWSVAATGPFTSKSDDDGRITTRIGLGKWTLVLDGRVFRVD
jgi:hypothetical protein